MRRLDGPAGSDFGPPLAAAAAAFPSVCSAPVPGAGAPRGLAPDGMGTAKPSCESITEHFDLPFMADMLTGEGFERICAAATAAVASPGHALPLSPMGSSGLPAMGSAKLPPRPSLPRSSSASEPGSSPRRASLDGSPGASTNPSPNPSARLGGGGRVAALEPEPMQEEALQTLSLFDGEAVVMAERAHPPPPPQQTYRGEAVRCVADPCVHVQLACGLLCLAKSTWDSTTRCFTRHFQTRFRNASCCTEACMHAAQKPACMHDCRP